MVSQRTSRRICGVRHQRLVLRWLLGSALMAFCDGWSIHHAASALPRLQQQRPEFRRLSHMNDDESSREPMNDSSQHSVLRHRRQWLRQCLTTVASVATASGAGITTSPQKALAATAASVITTPAVCDATVTVWKQGDKQRLLYLLGTAHISEISAQLAGTLVDDVHPNAVFVELDLKRIQQVTGKSDSSSVELQKRVLEDGSSGAAASPADDTTAATSSPSNASRIIVPIAADDASTATTQPQASETSSSTNPNWFQRRVLNFATRAVGNALRGMYSNLNDAGFQPGEEFAAAMRQGRAAGAVIVLGDQDVELTLRRLTEALARTDLNQLMDPDAGYEKSLVELMPNGAPEPVMTNYDDPAQYKKELAAYVEKLKSRESVRKIVAQLKEVAPALVEVMLTERDAYMARGIDTLNEFEVMVAVMGLAHQDGVEANLKERGWRQVRLSCPPALLPN